MIQGRVCLQRALLNAHSIKRMNTCIQALDRLHIQYMHHNSHKAIDGQKLFVFATIFFFFFFKVRLGLALHTIVTF